jgi:hypothetical protein
MALVPSTTKCMDAIVANTVQQGAVLSPDMTAWLAACPNPATVQAMLRLHMWLETPVRCLECGENETGEGEPMRRKDLRWDTVGPFCTGTELICRSCWDMFCEPTLARPKRRQTPWPDHLDVRGGQDLTYRGQVRLKLDASGQAPGPVIGTVRQYNPAGHTGKVILFAMQEHDRKNGIETCEELGSLDPDWEVVQDGTNHVVPQRHTLVEELAAEIADDDSEQALSDAHDLDEMRSKMGDAVADLRSWLDNQVRAHAN